MDHLGIQLVVMLVCGVIAAAIASAKGRNVVGWFFAGFFLGLVGIIVAAVMSNLKEERARRSRADQERRRLREQLRQEQLKNAAFQRHAVHRLDVHDHALRMDTRQTPALGEGHVALALDERTVPAVPPLGEDVDEEERAWHYAMNGEPVGPVPESALREMLASGELAGGTLVWTRGQATWVAARTLEAFRDVVGP